MIEYGRGRYMQPISVIQDLEAPTHVYSNIDEFITWWNRNGNRGMLGVAAVNIKRALNYGGGCSCGMEHEFKTIPFCIDTAGMIHHPSLNKDGSIRCTRKASAKV